MEQAKTIKHFFFGTASYHVSDGDGDEVVLQVNYAGNSFTIETRGEKLNQKFREELGTFAYSLLARKHKTDFAQKRS